MDIPDEKETCLIITIYMKIPGYEPKLSLQFKKDLKILEKKKTNSYSKNKSSSIDGGEGGIRTHVPVKANAFRVRPVMTTSISLRVFLALYCSCSTSEIGENSRRELSY